MGPRASLGTFEQRNIPSGNITSAMRKITIGKHYCLRNWKWVGTWAISIIFRNALGQAKKAAKNINHGKGLGVMADITEELDPFCSDWVATRPTVTKLLRGRQGCVWLVSETEPHVRTCVWMCEVTCMHVGYSKTTMGGNARWKEEGVAAMWVTIHKHTASRGDVTASQISLLVSTWTSVYITSHFSLFFLFLSFSFLSSLFISVISSKFHWLFLPSFLSLLLFLPSSVSFFLSLFSIFTHSFPLSYFVPIFPACLRFFLCSFLHFLSSVTTRYSCYSNNLTAQFHTFPCSSSSSLYSRYARHSISRIIIMSQNKFTECNHRHAFVATTGKCKWL